MFDFLRPSEIDILTKYVTSNDSVIVIAPFISGSSPDLTLLVLAKIVQNRNVTAIDIQDRELKGDSEARQPWGSDLYETRAFMNRSNIKSIKYTLTDALSMPFRDKTFDVIIDRITHEFIVERFDARKIEQLIISYNRVLRRNGRILFFSREEGMPLHEEISRQLSIWGYRVIKGKLKKKPYYIIEGKLRTYTHNPQYYIVAIKR